MLNSYGGKITVYLLIFLMVFNFVSSPLVWAEGELDESSVIYGGEDSLEDFEEYTKNLDISHIYLEKDLVLDRDIEILMSRPLTIVGQGYEIRSEASENYKISPTPNSNQSYINILKLEDLSLKKVDINHFILIFMKGITIDDVEIITDLLKLEDIKSISNLDGNCNLLIGNEEIEDSLNIEGIIEIYTPKLEAISENGYDISKDNLWSTEENHNEMYNILEYVDNIHIYTYNNMKSEDLSEKVNAYIEKEYGEDSDILFDIIDGKMDIEERLDFVDYLKRSDDEDISGYGKYLEIFLFYEYYLNKYKDNLEYGKLELSEAYDKYITLDLVKTSEDGEDIFEDEEWTSLEAREEFLSHSEKVEKLLNSSYGPEKGEGSDKAAYDQALDFIESIINEYNESKKSGSKKRPIEPVEPVKPIPPTPPIKNINLDIDYMGGSLDGKGKLSKSVKKGYQLKNLVEPERKGFHFLGWSKTKDGHRIDLDKAIKEDTKIYALWEVKRSKHKGYIQGMGNGLYKPDENISREEVAEIVYRLDEKLERKVARKTYRDLDSASWSYNSLNTLYHNGIIKGVGQGYILPSKDITRAEAIAILVRYKGLDINQYKTSSRLTEDISGHWAEKYIITALEHGIVDGYGDGSVRPDSLITRAEFIKVANRIFNRCPKVDEELNIEFKDVKKDDWHYHEMIEAIVDHEYINDDGYIWY